MRVPRIRYHLADPEAVDFARAKALGELWVCVWARQGRGGAAARTCSSPMRDRSQTMRRRSAPQELSTVSFLGDHPIWNTSSAWCSSTCSRRLRFRRSWSATCSRHTPPGRIADVCLVSLPRPVGHRRLGSGDRQESRSSAAAFSSSPSYSIRLSPLLSFNQGKTIVSPDDYNRSSPDVA